MGDVQSFERGLLYVAGRSESGIGNLKRATRTILQVCGVRANHKYHIAKAIAHSYLQPTAKPLVACRLPQGCHGRKRGQCCRTTSNLNSPILLSYSYFVRSSWYSTKLCCVLILFSVTAEPCRLAHARSTRWGLCLASLWDRACVKRHLKMTSLKLGCSCATHASSLPRRDVGFTLQIHVSLGTAIFDTHKSPWLRFF